MNEKITRVSSDAVFESSRTDWARLKALTDEEIEQAIAGDPDWAAFEPSSNAPRIDLTKATDGSWRWQLFDASGAIIAISGQDFATRADALRSLDDLRNILAKAA